MRYVITIFAVTALFVYLYKRTFQDFRSGYEEGLKIGNALSQKQKRSQKERQKNNHRKSSD